MIGNGKDFRHSRKDSTEVMICESSRIDKMVHQAKWSFHLVDVLPKTAETKMNETLESTKATLANNGTSENRSSFALYRVPGQYMYEELLLGAGIPPTRMEEIRKMNMEVDDVIIASYPKTGTTLLQEIVWLINNRGDVDRANESYNYERILFIEFTAESLLDATLRPRHFKTHVPYRFLPTAARSRQTKVVYIMRNPKDVLVSYYYFYRMCKPLGNFKGTWNDFFQLFVHNDGKLYYGNMFDHMLAYWNRRHEANLLIVFYENVVRHPDESVRKIAKFLEKDLSDIEIEAIVNATSFKTMKENPRTNWSTLTVEVDMTISPFMRRGTVGDWKTHFTSKQIEIFDRMANVKLRNSGLNFTYE